MKLFLLTLTPNGSASSIGSSNHIDITKRKGLLKQHVLYYMYVTCDLKVIN